MDITRSLQRPRRVVALAAVAASLSFGAFGNPAAHAQAVVDHDDNTEVVVDTPVPINDCINQGAGETLLFSGTLQRFASFRSDAAGGFHVTLHTNLAGASAVGATTGIAYRVTDTAGGFGDRLNLYFPAGSQLPRSYTESADVRIISKGSSDNLLIRATWQQTINANGGVTSGAVRLEHLCVG
jgi:hypothetical protein